VEHQSYKYRVRNPKRLYTAMDTAKVKTQFCLLAKFTEPVNDAIVLIAEGVFANIFASWQSDHYMSIRADSLPALLPYLALNRMDPLVPFDKFINLRQARVASLQHDRKLKASQNGTWKVRKGTQGNFIVALAQYDFHLPKKVAAAWNLADKDWIDLDYQVTEVGTCHPRRWALKAISTDAAARLGIQCSKLVDGVVRGHWLEREAFSSVAVANTFVDWLTGKIEDVNTHV